MLATTTTAKRLLPFFRSLADLAGVQHKDVKLSISDRNQFPQCRGASIQLPDLSDSPELFASTFLHELQHARDTLDGVSLDLTLDELEKRARAAESKVSKDLVAGLISTHFQ